MRILFILLLLLPVLSKAQKAYENIKYKASTNNFGIVDLNYANGYKEASTITFTAKAVNRNATKNVKFVYAVERSSYRQQYFFLVKDDGSINYKVYFKLKFTWDKTPSSISGTLHGENGQDYTITFMKQRS